MNAPLEFFLLVVGVANLIAVALLWIHVDRRARAITSLESRMTRVEERQANSITIAETRQIYEQLASMNGQLETSNQLMGMIQKFLLERDK